MAIPHLGFYPQRNVCYAPRDKCRNIYACTILNSLKLETMQGSIKTRMDRIIMVYVLELHIMNKSHKQDFEEKKADIN